MENNTPDIAACLSAEDRQLALDACRAVVAPGQIPDSQFEARLSVPRDYLRDLVDRWPAVRPGSDASAVLLALYEVSQGITFGPGEWVQRFSVPRERFGRAMGAFRDATNEAFRIASLPGQIEAAAQALAAGGLVAFPTETVYGLGADATNPAAVAKIFAAKGRPATNPLIVHVADVETATRYAADWGEAAQALAAAFWPGPLALVVPKNSTIVEAATAGRPTVALRVPGHPVALQLLRRFGGPVAAPSANKSNNVSPTTADHVLDELGDVLDALVDGGPCSVGIESTVVDLTGPRPVVLRPGGVSRERIEAVVGPVDTFEGVVDPADAAPSPGQHARHYAPRTPAVRFETPQRGMVPSGAPDGTPNGLIAIGPVGGVERMGRVMAMPLSPDVYARHLYAVLRELDAMGLGEIYIEMPPAQPQWEAVRDRITRATRPLT